MVEFLRRPGVRPYRVVEFRAGPAVARQAQADLPVLAAPGAAEGNLAARGGAGDPGDLLGIEQRLAVGASMVLAQGGAVEVGRQFPVDLPVLAKRDEVVTGDVDTAGAGVGTVGQVMGTDRTGTGRQRDPRRGQGIDGFLAGIGGAVDDAVADADLVGVDVQPDVFPRAEYQAKVEAGRLLRLQFVGAEHLRRRRVGRQQAKGDGRADAEAGVVLLDQGRRAEPAAYAGAQRHPRIELVTGGELAVGGAAEVAEFLVAHRHVDLPGWGQGGTQVQVGRPGVPRPLPLAERREASQGFRPAAVVGRRVAGVDAVAFPPVFRTQRQRQRSSEEIQFEFSPQVQVAGPLAVAVARQVEASRAVAGFTVDRRVHRLGHADIGTVGAVATAQVPVPGIQQTLAAHPGEERIVVLVAVRARREAVRIQRRRHRSQAIVGRRGGLAPGIGAEAVHLDIVAQPETRVERQRLPVERGIAHGNVVAPTGALIDAAAHRALLLAIFGGEVDEAAIAEGQPDVPPAAMGEAVAVAGLPDVSGRRPAAVGGLEDDVDHPGDGVRTVLRRGAVAQHLDPLDGVDRDGVQIDPGGALLQPAADIEIGRFVATLAVHQHQHMVGAQPAQRLRVGQRRGVERLGLAGQRGQQFDQRIAQIDRTATA